MKKDKKLLLEIAAKQLFERKRQSLVSILGIILGTAFFLAISSLMQGSEKDFLKRLVDNSPHITISDEFRNARVQPVEKAYSKESLIKLSNLKPKDEIRGIRNYKKIIIFLKNKYENLAISPVLIGQSLVNYAGRDESVTINGMIPSEINSVSTIGKYMTSGKIEDLEANSDGIIIGEELARVLSTKRGNSLKLTTANGISKTFKIVGLFRTGRSSYDKGHTYINLTRAQSLLQKTNRANTMIAKLSDPYQARDLAGKIEKEVSYKALSWQESSEDITNALAIRNVIMYTVVSAVLIVAAFGIYNVISTIVLEKQRDIAILKSIGFYASDIKIIFIVQGIFLGILGCLIGLPLGALFMYALSLVTFKPPGSSQEINMPTDWSIEQFLLAAGFALTSSVLAAYLPSKKAAKVQPVDILRGGAF